MADAPPRAVLLFEDFRLDLGRACLLGPGGAELALRPKSFDVLRHLAENAGRLVTRDELMQAVWPDVFVTDDSITQCVAEIRRALGDGAQRLLRTVPKRGYLFAAEVARGEPAVPTPPPAPPADGEPAVIAVTTVPPVEAAERRHLTVLCCDLVDSTALSARLDPEELHELLAAYRDRVAGAVGREDGHVAGCVGDGVFAYFGWPRAHEDDAERAIRAGLAATAAVAALGTGAGPLAARVGIATGLVVVGEPVGEGEARGRDAIGEAPNLAARLQALAGPGGVVLDAATRRLAGGLFDYADMGEALLKGFAAPVRAWRALGEAAAGSRFEALRAAGGMPPAPLIGRDEELEMLLRRWRQAAGGEGRVVLLSGEPGIGKSRLVAALGDALAGGGAPHDRLFWYCSPQHAGSVLHPVVAWLGRAAGFARGDAPAERSAKLEALLAPDDPAPEDIAFLAELLGVPAGDWQLAPDLSPQRRRERTLEALLRRVEALSRSRPVLAVVEDAHWADPTTRELLDLLVARVEGLPMLLVVTHRPEFQAPWVGQAPVTAAPLSRLGRRESATLVARVAGGQALPAALVDDVVGRTDGVPLFVEELTKVVLEGRRAGFGEVAPGIPATLRASLAARLDRHPRARRAAQLGAVVGRAFPHDLVACLSEAAPAELEEGLERLVSAGLVSRRGAPPEAAYTFSHALLQEAAYDSLLRSRRRTLHGKVLRLLEDRRPEIVEREPETLARHAALAGEATSAAGHLLRAGQRAMRGYALAEAEAHLAAGLDLLAGEPDDDAPRRALRLDLQIALGQALMASRGYGDAAAGRAFDRARELSEGAGDPERAFSVLHGEFLFHHIGGRPTLALAAAGRMLEIAGRDGGGHLLPAGRMFVGMAEFHTGHFAAALAHLRAAAAARGPDGPGRSRLRFVSNSRAMLAAYEAWALLATGEVEAADRADREAWAAAEGSRAALSNAGAFCFSCMYSLLRGDAAAARRKLGPTVAFCAEKGFPYWLAGAVVMQALSVAEEGGQAAEGVAEARRAFGAYRATGSSLMSAAALGMLARQLTRLGQIGEALGAVAEALDTARATDDRWFEVELHRIRGEALLAAGDRAAAEAALREALSVARSQGAALWELRAALRLAPLLADREARREACDLLAEVIGRMPTGSGAAEMQEAEELLGALRPSAVVRPVLLSTDLNGRFRL